MGSLSIGQVAREAGIGVETVRFYERRGLIEEPARRASGYRQYGTDVVERLRFIRETKSLGFTLNEIKELLSLRLDPEAPSAIVKERVDAKITDVQNKIRSLQRMERELAKLTAKCDGQGPTCECPILISIDRK